MGEFYSEFKRFIGTVFILENNHIYNRNAIYIFKEILFLS